MEMRKKMGNNSFLKKHFLFNFFKNLLKIGYQRIIVQCTKKIIIKFQSEIQKF